MTVDLTASFKLIIFNIYLVYQPRSHPKQWGPASPIFRGLPTCAAWWAL